MATHQKDYDKARHAFLGITEALIKDIAPADVSIADLIAQRCIFRMHRDLRFSKDKSPYKTNMGASLAPGGRRSGYAGYYLHLEPGDRSFVAGGLYQPTTDVCSKIRQEIDYQTGTFMQIINQPHFKRTFGELEGEKLKKPPRPYDAHHPQIEFLKMKSFLVVHAIKDEVATSDDFYPTMIACFYAMVPFNKFLNGAIGIP